MPMSEAHFKATFGTAFIPNNAAMKAMIYTTYAGDPTNNVTPDFIGQFCYDTANEVFYIAATAAAAGWAAIHS